MTTITSPNFLQPSITCNPELPLRGANGIYHVEEDGMKFHPKIPEPLCQDGEEFLERFRNNFSMNILETPSPNDLVLELIGIDASFANALRRIMIAEVPTIAIEHVYMWNNSSIIHDEILSHRLGLLPINVDPRLFDSIETNEEGKEEEATDRNTIVFRLCVKCHKSQEEEDSINDPKYTDKKPNIKQEENNTTNTIDRITREESIHGNLELDKIAYTASMNKLKQLQISSDYPNRPYTKHIYSSHLEWIPQGDQQERFSQPIRPVHEDILLAKLREGQIIELEAHARKGIGKDHAKYSPVATASYRLMPNIELMRPVYDEKAKELMIYEPGVFCLEKCQDGIHRVEAKVKNCYACTMSRNYMRDEELKDSVRITRIPNHYIFNIESLGMLKPGVILKEALQVLMDKCERLYGLLEESEQNEAVFVRDS